MFKYDCRTQDYVDVDFVPKKKIEVIFNVEDLKEHIVLYGKDAVEIIIKEIFSRKLSESLENVK